jgi:hypothetical protein
MKTSVTALTFALSSIAFACTPAGTEPHAMSAADHQAAAGQEQQLAAVHAEQFKPEASSPVERCASSRGGSSKGSGAVCWTSMMNP